MMRAITFSRERAPDGSLTATIARDDCGRRSGQIFNRRRFWIRQLSRWRRLRLHSPTSLRSEKRLQNPRPVRPGSRFGNKLTSDVGKAAVNDLEADPQDSVNRMAAEAALSKFLKSDPHALTELVQLLGKVGDTSTTLTANVVGESIVNQASGSGITISINKAPTPGKSSKAK